MEPGQRLVLDPVGRDFCDSSGISALVAARHHTQAAGVDLALAALPANTV
ncbi:STAS domain-containing protein [Streptomyces sp. MAG02]|nr:STAS domain-containing protein [Streptomyces sp. MAG02]